MGQLSFTRLLKLSGSQPCHGGSQIGDNLDRESVRVRLLGSLTRRLGNVMRAPQKLKRKNAKAKRTFADVSSTLSMATHNLVNMVAMTVVTGAILLVLLAAKH